MFRNVVRAFVSCIFTPAINRIMLVDPTVWNSAYLFLIAVKHPLIIVVNVILVELSCIFTPAINFIISVEPAV